MKRKHVTFVLIATLLGASVSFAEAVLPDSPAGTELTFHMHQPGCEWELMFDVVPGGGDIVLSKLESQVGRGNLGADPEASADEHSGIETNLERTTE